jgi:glucose-6-phosphate 1-epimerase
LRYRDCVSGAVDCLESASLLRIEGEIDRIYANATAPLELRQADQTTYIGQTGFSDTVIWNPGAEKGSELGDLEPGGFARMLCVEAAAVMQAIHLAPGTSWSGAQILRVAAL